MVKVKTWKHMNTKTLRIKVFKSNIITQIGNLTFETCCGVCLIPKGGCCIMTCYNASHSTSDETCAFHY